jgi:Tol biopolymer transport system component
VLALVLLTSASAGCDASSPVGPSPPAGPPPPATGGVAAVRPLAFVSTRDGARAIYVAQADGSNAIRLAAGEAPAWSADGRRIAFHTGSSVCVMNADGSDLRTIGRGSWPSWSPDGTRIAFTDDAGLHVVHTDGSDKRLVVPAHFRLPGDGLTQARWSPDGQTIAFVANNFEWVSQIYLVSPGGGEPRVLIGGTSILTQFSPAWSPDGAMLALTHVDQVFTYFSDGTGRRQQVSQAFEPDWTPDGQFVFARPQAGFGSPLRIHVGTGASTRQLVPDVPGQSGPYTDTEPTFALR